jgi:hypothetical protein
MANSRAMRSVASEQRFAASGEINLHGVTRDIQAHCPSPTHPPTSSRSRVNTSSTSAISISPRRQY